MSYVKYVYAEPGPEGRPVSAGEVTEMQTRTDEINAQFSQAAEYDRMRDAIELATDYAPTAHREFGASGPVYHGPPGPKGPDDHALYAAIADHINTTWTHVVDVRPHEVGNGTPLTASAATTPWSSPRRTTSTSSST